MKVDTTVKIELTLEEADVIGRFLDSLEEDLPDEVDTLMVQLPTA